MMVVDRIVCEVQSQVKVPKSVADGPRPYELVGRPLLDCDQSAPKLCTLVFIVVKVPWYLSTMIVTRALVGCEFLRAKFLFLRLQIWQHAKVALVQVAIAIDETSRKQKYKKRIFKGTHPALAWSMKTH